MSRKHRTDIYYLYRSSDRFMTNDIFILKIAALKFCWNLCRTEIRWWWWWSYLL